LTNCDLQLVFGHAQTNFGFGFVYVCQIMPLF
jgi:hypothetical protein